LFSVGSSGIETALAGAWGGKPLARKTAAPAKQILVLSGSCSPVTGGQIAWALKHGFVEVQFNLSGFAKDAPKELNRIGQMVNFHLEAGRSVIFHTTKRGADKKIPAKFKGETAFWFGSMLGFVAALGPLYHKLVSRVCIAGGDTSSYAARAMGIEALEMIAPLTPGAPLCRAFAPSSAADGCEVVFKGGQVGPENYFEIVLKGK
jgi:3-oxoisoapionate kinase